MVKIAIVSDTHGNINPIKKVVRKEDNIDMIIHLGDHFRDGQKISRMYPHIPVEFIRGNCDFSIGSVPDEKILKLCEKRILITHGHRYLVKSNYDDLHRKAEELELDLLLFGHTHVPALVHEEEYSLLNPGSLSYPRNLSKKSYAIVDIHKDKVNSEIFYL